MKNKRIELFLKSNKRSYW